MAQKRNSRSDLLCAEEPGFGSPQAQPRDSKWRIHQAQLSRTLALAYAHTHGSESVKANARRCSRPNSGPTVSTTTLAAIAGAGSRHIPHKAATPRRSSRVSGICAGEGRKRADVEWSALAARDRYDDDQTARDAKQRTMAKAGRPSGGGAGQTSRKLGNFTYFVATFSSFVVITQR